MWMQKTLVSSGASGIVGLACRPTGSGGLVIQIGNPADDSQLKLQRSTDTNVLTIWRGPNLLANGTFALAANTWYYVEFKWTLDNTSGATEVRVNGVTDPGCTLSGVDTLYSGTDTSWNAVLIGCQFNTASWWCDDIYISDLSGGVNDDFLGDVTVQGRLPDGNGTNSDFTGSDGDSTNNYLLVDEQTVDYPDDDGTYVQSSTIGHYDTYTYPALSTTATVLAVQVGACAKKTDSGARTYKCVAKLSGGAETDGSTTHAPSEGSYSYGLEVWNEKPGGGSWSVSDVDNAEFGVTVTG